MNASEYQLHVSFSRRHQAGQQRASLLLIVQEDGVLVLCSPWGGSLTGKNFLPVPPKYLSFCHKPEKNQMFKTQYPNLPFSRACFVSFACNILKPIYIVSLKVLGFGDFLICHLWLKGFECIF